MSPPQWGPAVAQSNTAPLFVFQQKHWLKLVEPNLVKVRAEVTLPGEHPESEAGFGTVKEKDGRLLIITWSSDDRGEIGVFKTVRDKFKPVLENNVLLNKQILQVAPVESTDRRKIFLVFTDLPEFWEVQ